MNFKVARLMNIFSLPDKIKALRSDSRGATAVEFALILPVMVLLYMSTVEISQAISVQRKVAIASGTLGDLTAQQELMTDAKMDLIFGSTSATILPYSSAPLTAVIKSIKIDSGGSPSVVWGFSWNGGSKTPDTGPETLSADLQVPNTSVIYARISYNYTSPIEFIFPTSRTLTSKTYFRPRLNNEITYQTSAPSGTAWPLSTTGPDASQIGENYIGFGAEYEMGVRPVDRDGNGAPESPPGELQNAQNCYYGAPACNPAGPGGGGDPGGGGGGGPTCYASRNPYLPAEEYLMPMYCAN